MPQIAKLHSKSWQDIYKGELSHIYLTRDIYQDRYQVWQQRFQRPLANQRIFVACDNNEKTILGFICFYLDNHPQWGTLIENLHIDKSCKGRGVGKQLLQTAARLSYDEYTAHGMYLEVLASNTTAQAFYQKFGARHCKTQQWQAPDGSLVNEYVYRWDSADHLKLSMPHTIRAAN